GAARLCGAAYGDGERQRHRDQGDPYLRRTGHAEELAARAHLPRQPLRLAHVAVDGRNLPRPARARDLVRAGRNGRVIMAWAMSAAGTLAARHAVTRRRCVAST